MENNYELVFILDRYRIHVKAISVFFSVFFFLFIYKSYVVSWLKSQHQIKKTDKQSGNRDLFAWQLQADHKWLMNPLQTCTQLWPPYMSAGISLCEIPGGKLQLPVLSRKKEKKTHQLLPLSASVRWPISGCGSAQCLTVLAVP